MLDFPDCLADSVFGLVLAPVSLLLVDVCRVLFCPTWALPRRRPPSIQGGRHAAVHLEEVLVGEQSSGLMILLAGNLRHVLPLHLSRGDLLHNVGDELVHGALHLLIIHRQVSGLVYSDAVLKHCQRPTHPVGPSLHVLNLQGALLQPLATVLVLLEDQLQLTFILLDLHVDRAGPACRVCVEGYAIGIALEPVELFPEVIQPDLSFLHRALELLVLHVSIQELVHDVHDICKTSDLADFLKAI
mmetsp:Transcript_27022/g.48130  ORF Transcript_27022/g.48130 Transcript_27022/m.48130 type:complete len:244 (-) Transcript_27022:861-1592(-)